LIPPRPSASPTVPVGRSCTGCAQVPFARSGTVKSLAPPIVALLPCRRWAQRGVAAALARLDHDRRVGGDPVGAAQLAQGHGAGEVLALEGLVVADPVRGGRLRLSRPPVAPRRDEGLTESPSGMIVTAGLGLDNGVDGCTRGATRVGGWRGSVGRPDLIGGARALARRRVGSRTIGPTVRLDARSPAPSAAPELAGKRTPAPG